MSSRSAAVARRSRATGAPTARSGAQRHALLNARMREGETPRAFARRFTILLAAASGAQTKGPFLLPRSADILEVFLHAMAAAPTVHAALHVQYCAALAAWEREGQATPGLYSNRAATKSRWDGILQRLLGLVTHNSLDGVNTASLEAPPRRPASIEVPLPGAEPQQTDDERIAAVLRLTPSGVRRRRSLQLCLACGEAHSTAECATATAVQKAAVAAHAGGA